MLLIFLTLMFGIIEFSIALFDKAMITNASREAARAGIVLSSPKLTNTQITDVALNYCQSNLITFGSTTSPTVSITSTGGSAFGTPLTVRVSYLYTGLLLGNLLTSLTGPITLRAATVMNNE